jgi:short-subunit dehydrogenase
MKTALIIGGSTGIGLDIAKRLGARGAAVTITGRDTSKLDNAAAGIKQTGSPTVTTKAVDLYDRAQVDSLATELSSGAALDYVVNSAGYFFPTPKF